ncbi:YoaK family protein [Mycolicibacterium sp. 050158]|uniref:YoaK family protein n=1 Tax=Mycolicibacterium sp. 050158 TaxID=3090602 RepID=UPI00299F4A15|nr:YoaK family protein [Mycolicibacterium sp. 050158]MDX1892391.1 YoaK family protein [Mycolicibacterium sp. 050158]
MPDKGFPAHSKTRNRFAVALAVIAGTADAIGFIEYSQLFMSFMSGNTTRLGEAASGTYWEGVARFGGVIAIFCLGAFLGTLIAAWSGRWRLVSLLSIQATLLVVGTFLPLGSEAIPWHVYPIVLALGLQNATLQDEAGRSMALTYVTGTVVRFGAGLANLLLHKPAPSFWIQGPLWAGLTTGAVFGGVLQHRFGEMAFLVPAAMLAILATFALVILLRQPRSTLVTSEYAPQPDAHPEAKPTVLV